MWMDELVIEQMEKIAEKVAEHLTIQGVGMLAAAAITVYFLLAIFSDSE